MVRRKPVIDTNSVVVGLLRDLAAVQASKQSKWGYQRAADAIAELPAPLESYLQPERCATQDSPGRPLLDARDPGSAEHRRFCHGRARDR